MTKEIMQCMVHYFHYRKGERCIICEQNNIKFFRLYAHKATLDKKDLERGMLSANLDSEYSTMVMKLFTEGKYKKMRSDQDDKTWWSFEWEEK